MGEGFRCSHLYSRTKYLSRAIQPISISLGQENFSFRPEAIVYWKDREEKIDVVGNPLREEVMDWKGKKRRPGKS